MANEMNMITAGEIEMHHALVTSAHYIRNWGIIEYLDELCQYSDDPDLHRLYEILTDERNYNTDSSE